MVGINANPQIVKDCILETAFSQSTFGQYFIESTATVPLTSPGGGKRPELQFPAYPLSKLPKHVLNDLRSNGCNEKVKAMVEDLWNGQNLMAWYFAGEYNQRPAIFVEMKRKQDVHKEDSVCTFMHWCDDDDNIPVSTADLQVKLLRYNLTQETKIVLAARLIHWFTRSLYTSTSKPSWFDPNQRIPRYLLDTYTDEKMWQDMYDLTAIKTKLELEIIDKQDDTDQTRLERFNYLANVGRALEAMKAFDQAGNFYIESCHQFDPAFDQDRDRIKFTLYAGLAMKFARQLELAEEYFMEALRKHHTVLSGGAKSCFDPNTNLESHIWNQLLDLYLGSDIDSETNNLAHILLGLLLQCGWENPACVTSLNVVRDMPQTVLLPEYQTKAAANRALFAAFAATESRENIRRSVLAVASPQAASKKLGGSKSAEGSKVVSRQKGVRRVLKEGRRSGRVLPVCVVCLKSTEEDLRCPCQTVNYCCRDCQVQDWKAGHKKTCPLRKKK